MSFIVFVLSLENMTESSVFSEDGLGSGVINVEYFRRSVNGKAVL